MRSDKPSFTLLVMLCQNIQKHMGWDEEKVLFWMNTENPNIGGMTPFDLFQRRPSKCVELIYALMRESLPNDAQGS